MKRKHIKCTNPVTDLRWWYAVGRVSTLEEPRLLTVIFRTRRWFVCFIAAVILSITAPPKRYTLEGVWAQELRTTIIKNKNIFEVVQDTFTKTSNLSRYWIFYWQSFLNYKWPFLFSPYACKWELRYATLIGIITYFWFGFSQKFTVPWFCRLIYQKIIKL